MTLPTMLIWSAIAFMAVFLGFFLLSPRHRDEPVSDILAAPLWQRMAAPGELSQAHAFLENNCAACHTPVKGVEAQSCIVCHADNKAILQRQPTAFHGEINKCAACHLEHQGRVSRTTRMDHVALAHLGLRQISGESSRKGVDVAQVQRWLSTKSGAAQEIAASQPIPAHLQRGEELLNCAACHQTKDRHRGFFGTDCASCHATSQWTIAEFRHPSTASQSCVQCHQGPPSHYMMHFKMVSMKIAGIDKAQVNQCFLCHQTTTWNDIKGVGFYKHH